MKRVLVCVLAMSMPVLPAGAKEWRSAYTDLDLVQCTMIHSYEVGADYACPGYKGYPVLVSESDLRFAVSYGFAAREERARGQVFPQFNDPGARIEWLLAEDPERGEIPVGTILRFFIAAPDYEDPDRQVLVVTRIEPGNTCQIAHIDALANSDANTLAREAAARLIPDFDCGQDPQRIGNWSLEY